MQVQEDHPHPRDSSRRVVMQPARMHHCPFQHPIGRSQGTLRVVLCLRRRLGLRVGPLPRRDRRSQGGVLKVVPGTVVLHERGPLFQILGPPKQQVSNIFKKIPECR